MTPEEKKAYGMAKLIAFLIPIIGYIMSVVYITKGEGTKAAGVAIWATVSWFLAMVIMGLFMGMAASI